MASRTEFPDWLAVGAPVCMVSGDSAYSAVVKKHTPTQAVIDYQGNEYRFRSAGSEWWEVGDRLYGRRYLVDPNTPRGLALLREATIRRHRGNALSASMRFQKSHATREDAERLIGALQGYVRFLKMTEVEDAKAKAEAQG